MTIGMFYQYKESIAQRPSQISEYVGFILVAWGGTAIPVMSRLWFHISLICTNVATCNLYLYFVELNLIRL